MQKFSLLAAAILLAGCAPLQKSRTWETVRAVPHAGPHTDAPALDYAHRLHFALLEAGVEHKVVTFKFRYRSRLLLNREGGETAVLYRDTATPAHPWWLMAERLGTPVWLPSKGPCYNIYVGGHPQYSSVATQNVASQLAFYVRRPVSIVKVEDFPAKDATRAGRTKHDGKPLLKPFRQGKKAEPSRNGHH